MKTTRALIALSVLMGLSYWGKEGFATESKKATVHPLYVSLIQLVANPQNTMVSPLRFGVIIVKVPIQCHLPFKG